MIVRALKLKADIKDNFNDVPKGSYYYDAIGIAKTLGIAQGSGDFFNPDGNITREDMMVIVARSLAVSGIDLAKASDESLTKFNDSKLISSYAREAVGKLTKAGLIEGANGGVAPKSLATRAEIVVVLDRILNRMGAF